MGTAAETRRFRHRAGGTVESGEALLDLGQHSLMLDRAGSGHHDVGRTIVARKIIAKPAAVERAYRFRRAQNRTAERLVGKGHDLQMLENEIVRRIGDRADLLDDDVLLANELFAV